MEKVARERLEVSESDSGRVSQLSVPPTPSGSVSGSFYERFVLHGIRVDRVVPGVSITCSFRVPPHLIDRDGNLGKGAIATLVDEVGAAVVHEEEGLPMKVSTDMSISFISEAKLHDELEITSRVLGRKGRFCGAIVLITNKASGHAIAEGRHSLFAQKPQPPPPSSKI